MSEPLRDRGRALLAWMNRSVKDAPPGSARRAAFDASARTRMLPSYLVIGAHKAGTTSLGHYLDEHPQVLPAWKKEIGFFDRNFEEGSSWYRQHFPLRLHARARSARLRVPVITGEATPLYLFHPDAPARVQSVVPEAKLVVILREPVSRAYSHYWHVIDIRRSRQQKLASESFEDAISVELDEPPLDASELVPKRTGGWAERQGYLARGSYAVQLDRWLARFGSERIMVVSSRELSAAPGVTYEAVLRFLDLRAAELPTFPVLNQRSYPPMGDDTRARLRRHFEGPNQELVDVLSRAQPVGWEPVAKEIREAW